MAEPAALDWNDLKYFLAAARSRTLSGAARTIGVKHSTIGRRIATLERALGASLFIRQHGGLALTILGERMLVRAEEVERAVLGLQELVRSERKRVRLSCPSGFGNILAAEFQRFHRTCPDIELELLSTSHRFDLKKGEAEIALRAGPVTDEDLIGRKVADVAWSLYASEAYLRRHPAPADPRLLAGHDVLGFDAALSAAPGATWIEQHGHGATVVLRSRELTDTLVAARAGLGLAILPCILAEADPALKRLTKDVLGRDTLSLIYRREMMGVTPVQRVIDFIVGVMRKKAALIGGTNRST